MPGETPKPRSSRQSQYADPSESEDVAKCVDSWLEDVRKELKIKSDLLLIKEKFVSSNKATLSDWLVTSCRLIARQREIIEKMQEDIDGLKNEALADKETVIKLQEKLLHKKKKKPRSPKPVQEMKPEVRPEPVKLPMPLISEKKIAEADARARKKRAEKRAEREAEEEAMREKNLKKVYEQEKHKLRKSQSMPTLAVKLEDKSAQCDIKRHEKNVAIPILPVKAMPSISSMEYHNLLKERRLERIARLNEVYNGPGLLPKLPPIFEVTSRPHQKAKEPPAVAEIMPVKADEKPVLPEIGAPESKPPEVNPDKEESSKDAHAIEEPSGVPRFRRQCCPQTL